MSQIRLFLIILLASPFLYEAFITSPRLLPKSPLLKNKIESEKSLLSRSTHLRSQRVEDNAKFVGALSFFFDQSINAVIIAQLSLLGLAFPAFLNDAGIGGEPVAEVARFSRSETAKFETFLETVSPLPGIDVQPVSSYTNEGWYNDYRTPGNTQVESVTISNSVIRNPGSKRVVQEWISNYDKVNRFIVQTADPDILKMIAALPENVIIDWQYDLTLHAPYSEWTEDEKNLAARTAKIERLRLGQFDDAESIQILKKTKTIAVDVPESPESLRVLYESSADEYFFFYEYPNLDISKIKGKITSVAPQKIKEIIEGLEFERIIFNEEWITNKFWEEVDAVSKP
jgi:hypothetical protein